MLPVSFLRQLIGMYGNSMQAMMPSYLEAAMTNFRENQSKIREAFEKGIANNPIAKIHETNMAMMRAATEAFIPGAASILKKEPRRDASSGAIEALRQQIGRAHV